MRTEDEAEDESWVLTAEAGRALLAEVNGVKAPLPADVERWRSRHEARHVNAAIRLAETSRRGQAKYSRADRMWLEKTGLEQATAEAVALHKAARFAERPGVAVDLCCGIGGDALALAGSGPVLAVDRDHAMCRRALWNATAHDVGERVVAVQALAETMTISPRAWVHIDPDRRAGRSPRARRIAEYAPGLDFLKRLARTSEAGAIKLSPASDFATSFDPRQFEVELISLDGECKEATLWFGALRSTSRRATVLPSGATWIGEGNAEEIAPCSNSAGRYVFDPDPSLTRSGLLDGFAIAHGLKRLTQGVDYLTADQPVASPFLSRFEVLESLPLDLKRLKQALTARGAGTLEVKTRGVGLSPEALRARLKLRGQEPFTVLLAGGTGQAVAVIARRAR